MPLRLVKPDNKEPQFTTALTERQKKLIVSSYRYFEPNAARFAELFYQRLFLINPELKSLFSKNPAVRCGNMVKMLKIAIVYINDFTSLVPILRLLGSESYHQHPKYCACIGEEFMQSLEHILGRKWDEEINEAWATYFGILSEMMIRRSQGKTGTIKFGNKITKLKAKKRFVFIAANHATVPNVSPAFPEEMDRL